MARPSVPGKLNASLFEDPTAQDAGTDWSGTTPPDPIPAAVRPTNIRQLLTRAGTSATSDQKWVDEWYEGHLDGSRVKALEGERIFAVRQFELTTGRRIVVYTEIGGEPRDESMTEFNAVRDF